MSTTWSQPPLWNGPNHLEVPITQPMVRRNDRDTSNGAAVVALHDAPNLRARCLAALVEHGPLTDFELAAIVGRQATSAGKRRLDLQRAGLVEALYDTDGLQVRRPSPSGTPALVWQAVAS